MIAVFQGAAIASCSWNACSSLAPSARRREHKQPRDTYFIVYSLQIDVFMLICCIAQYEGRGIRVKTPIVCSYAVN
jgi:hypothetical protein